jgi:hypothetical protein
MKRTSPFPGAATFTERDSVQGEFPVACFRLLNILSTLVCQLGRFLNVVESAGEQRTAKKIDATERVLNEIQVNLSAIRRDFSVSTEQIRREFDNFRCSFEESKRSLKTEIDHLKRANSPNQCSLNADLGSLSFKPTSPLNGIISYLSHECGGNVVEKDIIRVFGSTQYGNYDERKIVDMNPDTYFHTENDPNSKDRGQWICYDFRRMRVTPTHYSIMTRSNYDCNVHQPKSWVIEISADEKNWTVIDERNDSDHVNGRRLCWTFDIANPKEARFIRLRQIAPNHRGDYYLVIAALEFFGTLRPI